jgi:hypothetical protein
VDCGGGGDGPAGGLGGVRGLAQGRVSPLREYTRLAITRAALVKGFAQALADRHGTTRRRRRPERRGLLDTVIRADTRLTSEICLCERTETITRSSASSQIKITA